MVMRGAEVLDPQTDAHNIASVKVDTRRISALLNLDRIAWDQAVLCECTKLIWFIRVYLRAYIYI